MCSNERRAAGGGKRGGLLQATSKRFSPRGVREQPGHWEGTPNGMGKVPLPHWGTNENKNKATRSWLGSSDVVERPQWSLSYILHVLHPAWAQDMKLIFRMKSCQMPNVQYSCAWSWSMSGEVVVGMGFIYFIPRFPRVNVRLVDTSSRHLRHCINSSNFPWVGLTEWAAPKLTAV